MTQTEIKRSFHELIDEIYEEKLLKSLYNIAYILRENRIADDGDWWDSLTEEQRSNIDIAIKESEDESKLISHEQVMKEARTWLKK